jgi:hypothetical protein
MSDKKDGLQIKDNVRIVLRGPDGKVKHESVHNASTVAGRNAIADQILAAPTLVKPTHTAIGTGSPAATLLGAEVARVAFTSKTRSGSIVTMVADYAAGIGTGAITEAGIFNIVTANTVDMYFSASFAVVNKLAADTLQISWDVTFS